MRIALVGSGTGGHFYPLIAVAEALRERDVAHGTSTELFFIGPDPYNKNALDSLHINFVRCPAGKRRVYWSPRNMLDLFTTLYGIFVAFGKLLWLYPDAVMSKGGYTSVPVVIAAWLLRIPIVLHESDAVAGRANVFAGRLARYIGIAHDDAAAFFPGDKVALIGMPVRRSFFTVANDPFTTLGVPNDRPLIFVTGGSLGAKRINDLVLNALDELLPLYTILHQTGPTHEQAVREAADALISDPSLKERYFVYGQLSGDQMSAAQSAAALIVSRAGSGSIFEIALKGKPSILIPIPEDVSRDQRTNAYAYAKSGAATVIEEHNLTDDILASEINNILAQRDLYQSMEAAARNFTRTDAADTLADALLAIGAEHE